ncbi:N-acyl-D-amino-acid deacylase family protein [Gaopeijia maritima]|uniref:D-aminoacylase n=1 Tax=Gaopeijia maritima TaxID=3119007 RepID=A0ABU9E731_9BACT
MRRRDFVRAGGVLAAGGFAAPGLLLASKTGRADLVLRGAEVFDGTGAPSRTLDVAITGDRIEALGEGLPAGVTELDLRGLALAPGFIDIHSHTDLSLLVEPRAESRIRQGVTLDVTGQDGSSILWSERDALDRDASHRERYGVGLGFRDLAGFFDRLDRDRPAVNVASMVGHGSARAMVIGYEFRPATEAETDRMRALVAEALAQGAVGLSSGLEYTPGSFADLRELAGVAAPLRGTGLPYASHMRNEDDGLLAALEECLQVGRVAGVPVQVSHLKAQGERNYWKAESALAMIEAARESGVEVDFDRYPYIAYATGLSNLFPAEMRAGSDFVARLTDPETAPAMERAARDKIALLGEWDAVQITSAAESTRWARGRRLGVLAAERGVDPWALVVELLVAGGGSVGMIGYGMDEQNTARLLAHPLAMVCSDGGSYAPYGPLSEVSPHPRAYGSFPRWLGHYVRDLGVLPLAEAIRRITLRPAEKLRLEDRGVIRVGAFADLVAFDPATIADGATFEQPHRYPTGIEHVVVNGVVTIRHGEQTGVRGGRPVRGVAAR